MASKPYGAGVSGASSLESHRLVSAGHEERDRIHTRPDEAPVATTVFAIADMADGEDGV